MDKPNKDSELLAKIAIHLDRNQKEGIELTEYLNQKQRALSIFKYIKRKYNNGK